MADSVVFDYDDWKNDGWLGFASIFNKAQATQFFNQVTRLYVVNNDRSPVRNLETRKELIYLYMAHLMTLNILPIFGGRMSAQAMLQAASSPGFVSEAERGEVKVSKEIPFAINPSMGPLGYTLYGQQFWQATKSYRSFRILAGNAHPPWSLP